MSYQEKENRLLRMAGVGHQDAGQPWLGLEDIVGGSYRLGYEQAIRELSAGLPLATQRLERDLADAETRVKVLTEELDKLDRYAKGLHEALKEAEDGRDEAERNEQLRTKELDAIRDALYAVTAAESRELFCAQTTVPLAVALIRHANDSGHVAIFGMLEDGKLAVVGTRQRTEADAVADGELNEFPF